MPPRGEFWWAASPARSTLPTRIVAATRRDTSYSDADRISQSRGDRCPVPSVPPAASSSPSSLRPRAAGVSSASGSSVRTGNNTRQWSGVRSRTNHSSGSAT